MATRLKTIAQTQLVQTQDELITAIARIVHVATVWNATGLGRRFGGVFTLHNLLLWIMLRWIACRKLPMPQRRAG